VAIAPQIALPTVIEGARFVGGADVVRIDRASSALRLYLRTGDTLDADCVVVCAGDGVASITGLRAPPIERRLGQVESARHAGPHAGPRAAPPWAIADGAYTVAAFNTLLFGATFEPAGDGPPSISENARQKNLAALGRLLPGVSPSSDQLTSRAGVRSTTRDRLPFAGPFAEDQGDHDGRILFLGGMGARGFLWSPMLADMLAAEVVVGEPCPVEIPVRQLLRPDRLL
jgi:tRNA 5-methylaminomethyl-2-thiouridine biosynthesis bifunctional protein